jgi:hypothetical protein
MELAVAVDGLDPENADGLRTDVFVNAPVGVFGCAKQVEVQAVISGTPAFWEAHADSLRGKTRLGIGLRTTYEDMRVTDWSGYSLPRDSLNLRGPTVQNPASSGKFVFSTSADESTEATWYIAEVTDWGSHWTPVVMEFEASLTSRRGLGECYVALPALIGVGSATVDDAVAASSGADSVFDLERRSTNRTAVTFGRVVVRTTGSFDDSAARPSADFVDGVPWRSRLGEIGDEAAVWRCSASTARAMPAGGVTNPQSKELALLPGATENDNCEGLAVVQSRTATRIGDLALLLIGALFALIIAEVVKYTRDVSKAMSRRLQARR